MASFVTAATAALAATAVETATSTIPPSTAHNGIAPAAAMPTPFDFPCGVKFLNNEFHQNKDLRERCGPPNFEDYWWSTVGYYSPALCPRGYTAGCFRWNSEQGPPVEATETAVQCVPRGYKCQNNDISMAFSGAQTAPMIQVRWASSDLFTFATHPLYPGANPTNTEEDYLKLHSKTVGLKGRARSSGYPDFTPYSTHSPGETSSPGRGGSGSSSGSSDSTSGSDSGKGGLSTGAKIGIGVGVGGAALLGLATALFFILLAKRSNKRSNQQPQMVQSQYAGQPAQPGAQPSAQPGVQPGMQHQSIPSAPPPVAQPVAAPGGHIPMGGPSPEQYYGGQAAAAPQQQYASPPPQHHQNISSPPQQPQPVYQHQNVSPPPQQPQSAYQHPQSVSPPPQQQAYQPSPSNMNAPLVDHGGAAAVPAAAAAAFAAERGFASASPAQQPNTSSSGASPAVSNVQPDATQQPIPRSESTGPQSSVGVPPAGAQDMSSLQEQHSQLEARRQRILELESIEQEQEALRQRMSQMGSGQ